MASKASKIFGWREKLGATVEMRLEACTLIAEGMHPDTRDLEKLVKGVKLHKYAESLAAKYRAT